LPSGIAVFTDVATTLDSTGLNEIVSNFADSSVGCVSSEDRVIREDGNAGGEGLYTHEGHNLGFLKLASQALTVKQPIPKSQIMTFESICTL
jgi:hypothetical protein